MPPSDMTGKIGAGHRRAWTIIALGVMAATGGAAWWWICPMTDGLAEARRAYQRGEWDRAAEEARRRFHDRRDDTEALRLYARASIRRNRDDVGNAIYKDRLSPQRMEPEDYYLVGLSLARLGRDEMALQVWEKGAAAGPEHPELLESLARQALALGRPETANSSARQLARLKGWEGRGWLLLGEARDQLDDASAAAGALDRGLRHADAARRDPQGLARARRLLARCWLRLGRPAEGREALEKSLVGNDVDADPEAHWLLSRAWLQQGRIEEATAALGRSGSFRAEHPLIPEPALYVGSARCVECHREISRAYRRTRHARTFHHGTGLAALPIPAGPLTDPDVPDVTLTFRRDGPRIRVETRGADKVLRAVVEYAFGTPERYVTMIGRHDTGEYRGLRLSYYRTAEGSGWGRTSGDAGSPDPHERIRGRPIDVRDGVVRCLVCHVTRPRDFREPPPADAGPESADTAIGCERCHGPGSNHLAAVAADWTDRAIAVARADTSPAATVNTQCAECHTVDFRSVIRSNPADPRFVRSPGFTMTFSRCYAESNGRLSCLTCHDPHREAEHTASFYERKCLSCHSSGRPGKDSPPADGTDRGRACPVAPTRECLDCHMPKILVADLHTILTDHYIRVRRRSISGSGAATPR
jgi:tetratricopeptide (TPR) repeat protein